MHIVEPKAYMSKQVAATWLLLLACGEQCKSVTRPSAPGPATTCGDRSTCIHFEGMICCPVALNYNRCVTTAAMVPGLTAKVCTCPRFLSSLPAPCAAPQLFNTSLRAPRGALKYPKLTCS